MMRNEAGSDSSRNGSKANGSDSAETTAEQQSSGNGLVQEFSKITDPKALSPLSGGEQAGAERSTTLPESGSSMRTDAGILGSGKVASTVESTNDALTGEPKPNGRSKQAAAGEFGKCKSTGVGEAFPSSAELLQGLKL
jgi:hypothetical protein